MKRTAEKLLFILIFITISIRLIANGNNNVIDDNSRPSLEFLPDSVRESVSNKKFMLYAYGHHGVNWCMICEEANSYNILIGTTREKPSYLDSKLDTARLMESYRNLICWGLDTLPYITKYMKRQYPEQWSTFYRSLSVFQQQSDCIFNSDNAIGFDGYDSASVNKNFHDLCYLMYWLSAPDLRSKLPGINYNTVL